MAFSASETTDDSFYAHTHTHTHTPHTHLLYAHTHHVSMHDSRYRKRHLSPLKPLIGAHGSHSISAISDLKIGVNTKTLSSLTSEQVG